MIRPEQEIKVTQERIAYFRSQLACLRKVEANPTNYVLSATGYIAEIDKMSSELREHYRKQAEGFDC